MNCIIRADSSFSTVTEHVARCLVLADALREREVRVSFICRLLPGHLCDHIEARSYKVHRLPAGGDEAAPRGRAAPIYERWAGVNWMADAVQSMEVLRGQSPNADWLVVDHYLLDRRWETLVRPFVRNIAVIDDLANRPHLCDLLLDASLSRDPRRYDALVPSRCRRFLGPSHALFGRELREARRRLRKRDGRVRRILVGFGGADPAGWTRKVLQGIGLLDLRGVAVDVVVGGINPRRDEIRALCAEVPGAQYHYNVEDMARMMAAADVAIGAGGNAMWERCFLGLPSIAVALGPEQEAAIETLAAEGVLCRLGRQEEDAGAPEVAENLSRLIASPGALAEMGRLAMRVMDEAGAGRSTELIDALSGAPGLNRESTG
jgi:UDP-2,4-diacetamido-2,4,6-trideoxy-beta-L-altropyranose hydrolase